MAEPKVEVEVEDTSYIDRMKEELSALDEKIGKAQEFVKSDKFKTITSLEQQMLYMQISTMSTYGAILHTRITLVEN